MAGIENAYKTIASATDEVVFRDRGSKFLGYLFPCSTIVEVQESLNQIKEKYPSATHHCYAYRLGSLGDEHRANDDGEPSGTAGLPIYNQLQSAQITQVLAVVVRFYGGTKLGSSGLINAYKEATKMAIANAKIITETPKIMGQIRFPYTMERTVKAIISRYDVCVVKQEFTHECSWVVYIPIGQKAVWDKAICELKTVTFHQISG